MQQGSRVLLTGFGPFRHYRLNPSEQMAAHFNGLEIGGSTIEGRVLPVSYRGCRAVADEIRRNPPQAVVMLGLRATHRRIGLERIAVNIADGRFPDETGDRAENRVLDPTGPDGIFATLPIHTIHNALSTGGFSSHISNSAGTYVCNALFYHVVRVAGEFQIPAGFVHIPAMKHNWSEDRLWEAVRVILETVAIRVKSTL